jgi:hypothetical protein
MGQAEGMEYSENAHKSLALKPDRNFSELPSCLGGWYQDGS